LAAGFISRAELLFLLFENISAAVCPLLRLFTRFASAIPDVLTSFFGLLTNGAPHLAASLRRIQNPYYGAESQTCQEPQKATAITIRHSKFLLATNIGW
jgi:hypothetical protein